MDRGQLPVPQTSFVGRSREIVAVGDLLATARVLTLTGPGGCGKTRLALEVARDAPDARFVDLAQAEDTGQVAREIAAAVGASEEPDRPLLDAIRDAIGDRTVLIILDTCEHIATACAEAVASLLACPALRVLATSRQPLGLAAETRWRVPSLDIPDPDEPLEVAAASDAVQLFVARARSVAPHAQHDPAVIARVCRRLDGLPLAIELAAARTDALALADIEARLDDRLLFLKTAAPDVQPRQRSLRAVVDWSHDLLTETERTLFRRLAVFDGPFTLDSVEQICAGDGLERVIDELTSLTSRALVEADTQRATYRLAESVRAYAAERLDASGERQTLHERHFTRFADLAERADAYLRLEKEHDQLRAALRWSLNDPTRTDESLRLAIALADFWETRGYLSEARSWLDAAIAKAETSVPRAVALLRAATLARVQGDVATTRRLSQEALGILRASGDEAGVASSLALLGSVTGSSSLSGDSLALRRLLRELDGVTSSLAELGRVAWEDGDLDAVRELHMQSLEIAKAIGDASGHARALMWLGNVGVAAGDADVAERHYRAALALAREQRDLRREADVLSDLGLVALARGDVTDARALHEQSLTIRREIGHRRGIAVSCLNLAELSEDARSYLDEAHRIAEELDDERIAAIARAQLASHAMTEVGEATHPALDDASTRSTAAEATLRREGDVWKIVFDGRTVRLKDSKGMRHLATLLGSPDREVHAIELAQSGTGGAERRLGFVSEDHLDRLSISGAFADAGAVLDEPSKSAYRRRLQDLREELDEAEAFGDLERAARARAETDAITEQLAAAVGLGGRDRKTSSASERARWSASRAIKNAIARIEESHPSLGSHLARTVRTGTFCEYAPDPRARVVWTIDRG